MATGAIPSKVIYSDFATDLDTNPITGKLLRVTNVDAVKQSIRNLVLTDFGERLMQPNLGGNVRALLFENITPQTMITAKHTLEQLISTHEPRARLIDVAVSTTNNDHEVQIQIVFAVINIEQPVTLDVVLQRIR